MNKIATDDDLGKKSDVALDVVEYDGVIPSDAKVKESDQKIIDTAATKSFLSHIKAIGRKIFKHWFIIGLAFVVLLAYLIPWVGKKGGPLKPEISTKILIGIVFFNSGIVYFAFHPWIALLHLSTQTFSFVLVPLFFWFIVFLLSFSPNFDPRLGIGVLVLSAMPTTISSNVVFTKAANGNEAAALFNSTFGNLIGLVASPGWIFLMVSTMGGSGNSAFGNVPFGSILLQLLLMVAAPVGVGQIVRYIFLKKIQGKNLRSSIINNNILLFVVFTVFCDTFGGSAATIPASSLPILIAVLLSAYILMQISVWLLTGWKWLKFTREDRVAVFFTSVQKTLGLGIPMISIIYEGDPNVGLYTAPLLVYHPMSLFICSLLTVKLKNWIKEGNAKDNESSEAELEEEN